MKLSIKAILIGYLIGFLASLVISLVEMTIYTRYSVSEIQLVYPYISISLNFIVKVIGGYITGRIAKKNEVVNAAILGFVTWLTSVLITIVMVRSYNSTLPIINLEVFGELLLCIFSFAVGGFISQKIREKKRE